MDNSDKELDKKRRDEFLLHWYDKVWESIDRKESGLWQFVGFYGAIAGIFLAAVQDKIIPEIAIIFSLIASFWGINVAINYCGWFNRNLLLTINIEKEFLDLQEDLGKIIPESYHKPKPKLFSGIGKIHIFAFSSVIFAIIGLSICLNWLNTGRLILSIALLLFGIILTLLNYFDAKKGVKTFFDETRLRSDSRFRR